MKTRLVFPSSGIRALSTSGPRAVDDEFCDGMMSFRFNFPNPNCAHHITGDGTGLDNVVVENQSEPVPVLAEEVEASVTVVNYEKFKRCTYTCGDQTTLHYLDCQDVEQHLCGESSDMSAISKAVQVQSDLLPGVYEGGLKVWECSLDLTEYLSSLKIAFRGLTVLELGCGAGLPGIYAMSKGAQVYFQDYNKEVITHFTIPNCRLNMKKEGLGDRGRFYHGDWESLCDLLLRDSGRFDLIFTSETIYNTQNYGKLHHLFERLITQTGKIYVAAKVYYFGVGGGVREFEDYIKQQKIFTVTSAVVHEPEKRMRNMAATQIMDQMSIHQIAYQSVGSSSS